jgi:hypothetical protein
MREAPQVSALPGLFGLARTAEWGGNPADPTGLETKHAGVTTAPSLSPQRQVFSLFINTLNFERSGTMLNRSA